MPTADPTLANEPHTPHTAKGVAVKSYRYRNGGLAYAAKYGMSGLTRLGGLAALSVYGPTPYHRRLRASDIRRKLTPAQYNRLMDERERSFGLAAGTIRRRPEQEEAA